MANIYRVRTVIDGVSGSPYLSTQFYELTAASSQAGAQQAVDAVDAFWSSLAGSINTNANVNIETTVDELNELTGALVASYSVTQSVTQPTATGDPLPPANQGLIRLNTGVVLDNHRIRGRIFVPGALEIDSAGSSPSAAYQTALNTAAALLFTSGTSCQIAVWHRPVRNAQGVVTRNGQAVVVNGVTAASYWAILRSRRD